MRPSAAAPALLASDPHAWLRATQVAVGRALERRELVEVRVDPAALDRPPALAVVAEAVDLVAGLARAGRLQVGLARDLVPAAP